jgi:hypothetical protein
LRFADDTSLLASSEEELSEILGRVKNIRLQYGLDVNLDKSKLMIVERGEKVLLTGCLSGLEVVNDFICLGSLISDTGSSQKGIKRRIMLGRVAMKKLTTQSL